MARITTMAIRKSSGGKIFNNGVEVGSGQILGNNDGVVTLDIDSLVPFDRIALKPVNNGQSARDQFNDNSDFLLINAEICCPTEKLPGAVRIHAARRRRR